MRVGIAGCTGRMGQALLREVLAAGDCMVAAGSERPGHAAIGTDVGAAIGRTLGVAIVADPEALVSAADVVIDFTAPEASVALAAACARRQRIHVVGTTGLKPNHEEAIRQASARTAIVQAANFSIGVNVLLQVTRQVAALLPDAFDIEIVEMHHRHKVDAPSGTALALGRAAAAGRQVDLAAVADRGRDGITGARKPGHIGFAVLRGGAVVGDHTVVFASDSERLELTHRAQDRSLFAAGAVRAARWARGKPPGLYGMDDVLGFRR
ncbi:MAG: 4-hydroxy-tetrahydrodipicolinate reductase [Alphaproteobacteria bacterium]|nr:4-hydroxy-tetrahydrodipicolinate reductase [Alphaproteobacteria bacterium]